MPKDSRRTTSLVAFTKSLSRSLSKPPGNPSRGRTGSKPTAKKLRVLLLAHPDLVPPEKPSAAEIPEAVWKAEFEVLSTLRELGHDVHVEPLLDDLSGLYSKAIEWRPHIAFNLMEEFDGVAQYDQNVVSYLELLRLPYTGCNPRGLMVARDKSLAKKLLAFHGVCTPEFEVFRRRQPIRKTASLPFPLIVKSLTEEASLGISQASIVHDERGFLERTLFMQDVVGTDVIVERFIDGRELYVGVLGNHRPELFPVWELVFPDALPHVATRRVKWDPRYRKKYRIHSRLAELPAATLGEVRHVASEAYRLLGLSGYARIDLRLSPEGEVYFIEANPNPHIGREEDFAASAAERGLDYGELLSKILSLGLRWKTGENGSMRLPIDSLLPDLVTSLARTPNVVLEASPGAGKTTRVPPAILSAPFVKDRKVIVLEPRRLAAKLSARRVAEERGERVGETVGYQFRQETVAGPRTRLLFLTEGMLMRRMLSDPRLSDTAAVVLDEFHERHLHGDAALASLLRLQRTERPDLRLVVMSATLEGSRLAELLGCDVLKSEVRQHPVEIRYQETASERPLELQVRDAVRGVMESAGDCLVFLPGLADIRRAETVLQGQKGFRVFPLYADLSKEEQDEALRPGPTRRVILSTNVAETSLTIEGVTAVVDSGLHRQASYSWWSGIPALKTRPISKASAIQRAGRAGRLGPGRCVRLYTKGDFEGRAPFETPEILRADLAQLVLELAAMGVVDPAKLPWLDAPPDSSLEAARSLLRLLGALGNEVTPLGRKMASIPAHPRIARLLAAADEGGVLDEAATLAALLAEGRLEGIDALESVRGRIDEGTRRTRSLLLKGFSHPKSGTKEALAKSVLAGFPDRVARVRGGDLVLSSGGSARIDPHEWDTSLFVALDLQEQKHANQARAQLRVRSVVPIEESWLFDLEPSPLVDKDEVIWDAKRGRVQGVSRLCCGQLVLAESETEVKDEAAAARILIKEGLGTPPDGLAALDVHDWLRVLGKVADAEALETDFARVEIVRGEKLTGKTITEGVLKALEGQRSLRDLDWGSAVLGDLRHSIDRLAPTSISLPSGRKTRIRYALGKSPWVESRLQDFFGMRKTPRILDGKVPLTLHLLAPNHRAVQVTSDLESFWTKAYPEVRKELGRKYPRHKWPESPY